jgi:hypothetical protein
MNSQLNAKIHELLNSRIHEVLKKLDYEVLKNLDYVELDYNQKIMFVLVLLDKAHNIMPAQIKDKNDREDIEEILIDMMDIVRPREY